QLAFSLLMLLVLGVSSREGAAAIADLWHEHAALLALRVVLGPLAALGIAYLIHRSLEIPQTMAATGLFYVAILAVLVGELLGRLILFRTSLPLCPAGASRRRGSRGRRRRARSCRGRIRPPCPRAGRRCAG